jgi:hypothetical protein
MVLRDYSARHSKGDPPWHPVPMKSPCLYATRLGVGGQILDEGDRLEHVLQRFPRHLRQRLPRPRQLVRRQPQPAGGLGAALAALRAAAGLRLSDRRGGDRLQDLAEIFCGEVREPLRRDKAADRVGGAARALQRRRLDAVERLDDLPERGPGARAKAT